MRGLFDLNEHLLLSHPDFPAQHDLPRLPDADAVCPREYQFPSLIECKLFFADKYSLDKKIFEIN